MNSQKKVKPFNPFGGEIFDDQSVMDLNQKLINGDITLEEYNPLNISPHKYVCFKKMQLKFNFILKGVLFHEVL